MALLTGPSTPVRHRFGGARSGLRLLASVAVLLVACTSGGEPLATPAPGSPTATAVSEPGGTRASAARLELPSGCFPFASWSLGETPVRAGGPEPVEVRASACAAPALLRLPESAHGLSIEWELQAPGEPGRFTSTLLAESESGEVVWRGRIEYPVEGTWVPTFRLGGLVHHGPPQDVGPLDYGFDPPSPDVPRPAVPTDVLLLDASTGRVERAWPGSERGDPGWLQGRDGEILAFVQHRGGEELLMLAYPASGEVEPLFDVRGYARLLPSPDGRRLAVIDGERYRTPLRLRLYEHATGRISTIALADSYPRLAWSPDSSSLLVLDTSLRLLAPDGRQLLSHTVGDAPASSIHWEPSGRSALVVLRARSRPEVLRVDPVRGQVETAFRLPTRAEPAGHPSLAISTDGEYVAFAWVDHMEDLYRLAILPAEADSEPLDAHVVAEFQAGAAPQYRWVDALAWSPDGRHLAFTAGGFDARPGEPLGSGIYIAEVSRREARLLARPQRGIYAGGPLAWTAGGSLLLHLAWACVQCDGGAAQLDLLDPQTGQLLRSFERAFPIEMAGGAQLLNTADGLAALDADGRLRLLLPDEHELDRGYRVAVSPDGNRLAVMPGGAGRAAAYGIGPEGDQQSFLASFDRYEEVIGPFAGGWLLSPRTDGWLATLPDGTRREIPLPDGRGVPGAKDRVLSTSPDRARIAYWVTPGPQLAITDIASGTTRLLETGATELHPVTWSNDRDRVAYLDLADARVVVIHIDDGERTAVDLRDAGLDLPSGNFPETLISFVWGDDPDSVVVLTDTRLWRIDLRSRRARAVADNAFPGRAYGDVQLVGSPDGSRLVAAASTGLFVLDGGSWTRVSRAGWSRETPTIEWSADGATIAYVAVEPSSRDPLGIVVARLDGSRSYILVGPSPAAVLRLLGWSEDGSLVYIVLPFGI
jgi:hypothetical protein